MIHCYSVTIFPNFFIYGSIETYFWNCTSTCAGLCLIYRVFVSFPRKLASSERIAWRRQQHECTNGKSRTRSAAWRICYKAKRISVHVQTINSCDSPLLYELLKLKGMGDFQWQFFSSVPVAEWKLGRSFSWFISSPKLISRRSYEELRCRSLWQQETISPSTRTSLTKPSLLLSRLDSNSLCGSIEN
jgi:hypothetical protein